MMSVHEDIWLAIAKTLTFGFSWKLCITKIFQTVGDANLHWASHIYTSLSDIDLISRSQGCGKGQPQVEFLKF